MQFVPANIHIVVLSILGTGALGLAAGAALASDDVLLAAGEHKYFCEIDCHIAYSLVDVVTASALGEGSDQVTADGRFYVVTLRTWFDPDTTSVERGDGVLYPNPRIVVVVDEEGGIHHASIPGMKALGTISDNITFGVPLRPGDEYLTSMVFDVPVDAPNPRLWVLDRYAETQLMIGHENSPFHGRVYFSLWLPAERTADLAR